MALIFIGKTMGYMVNSTAAVMGKRKIRQHQKFNLDPVDKHSP
jgi:hypothetical protein